MYERRTEHRYIVGLPVQVATDDSDVAGISRDLSATGLRLASSARLTVGAPVEIGLRLMPLEGRARRFRGTVVRSRTGADLHWPFELAIEFDNPAPEIEPLLGAVGMPDLQIIRRT